MGGKKLFLFVGIVVLLVVSAIGIGYLKSTSETSSAKTEQVQIETLSHDSENTASLNVLKGFDFDIEINDEPSDTLGDSGQIQAIEIVFKDGRKVETIKSYAGENSELANTFFKNADFSLKKIFPDQKRELLIVKSSEYLSRGEGMLAMTSFYMIQDDSLQEILQVLTQRDQTQPGEETNSLNGDFKIEKGIENLPVIRYSYNLNGDKSEILFTWNGEKFVDTTGKYSEVEAQFDR